MQTKSYADAADADADADDADADGIHTKNNMSPTPSEGGHNYLYDKAYFIIGLTCIHFLGDFGLMFSLQTFMWVTYVMQ